MNANSTSTHHVIEHLDASVLLDLMRENEGREDLIGRLAGFYNPDLCEPANALEERVSGFSIGDDFERVDAWVEATARDSESNDYWLHFGPVKVWVGREWYGEEEGEILRLWDYYEDIANEVMEALEVAAQEEAAA